MSRHVGFPVIDQPDAVHVCQNCGAERREDQLLPIKDVFERVAAGEPMPSGECPECGALCQMRTG